MADTLTFDALAGLISPVPPADFFARHWEASPLHVARRAPTHFSHVATRADFDFVVTLACELRNSSVELLLKGQAWGAYDAPRHPSHVSEVFDAYRRGATVRVVGAHRYWKPLWALCRELQQELSFPVRANLYCSPPDAQGAELHYDTHHVFVIQLAGRKHWRVYAPAEPLPLEHYPALASERQADVGFRRGAVARRRVGLDRAACGETVAEALLEAGDTLYVPRGFVHEAWCESEPSAHVAVGVHALTWADAAAVALGRAANADESLRRSLPPGFARAGAPPAHEEDFQRLLSEFARAASARAALEEIASNSVWDQPALGEGTLFGAHDDEGIEPDTVVERLPGLNLKLSFGEDGASTLFAGHTSFTAPAPLAPALEFVARTRRFAVAELPGGLSDAGRASLVRRLVRDGFLRVSAGG